MVTNLVGKKYDFTTYNCWHHVIEFRAMVGLFTPEFHVSRDSFECMAEAFEDGFNDSKGMCEVESPEDYDVLIFQGVRKGKTIYHSGVYFQGMVSHAHRQRGSVWFESLNRVMKDFKGVTFWR